MKQTTKEGMIERFNKSFAYWHENIGLKPAIISFIESEISRALLEKAEEVKKLIIDHPQGLTGDELMGWRFSIEKCLKILIISKGK